MKAISIRQPWAHLILYAGKDVENRTWPTSYRGPILIHAAKTDDSDAAHTALKSDALFSVRDVALAAMLRVAVERGGIIGRATIVDCVRSSRSPWFFGPYGFVLAGVAALPFYQCRGALGIFDIDHGPYTGAAAPTLFDEMAR